MPDWFDRFRDKYHEQCHVLTAGVGRLLVTQMGARVLGCQLPGVRDNLFWHPPDLETSATIGGGDRLWIAPEVAYYWPSLEQARQDPVKWARTPERVDPGGYKLVDANKRSVHLRARIRLTDVRVDKTIAFMVDRVVYVIDPPCAVSDQLSVCSFGLTNTLSLEHGDDDAAAGAWDILQVPPTGTLICPTTRQVEPTSYYDPFGPRHVQCDPRSVRFLIDGRHRIKMGIPAAATTGRMGYYRPLPDGMASLIVRIFSPLPGDTYVDVPRSADATIRLGQDALQAYNDDGTFGGFGEMEYHDPALVVGQGRPATRAGTCVTHVITGPDDAVRKAGDDLLGVAIRDLAQLVPG